MPGPILTPVHSTLDNYMVHLGTRWIGNVYKETEDRMPTTTALRAIYMMFPWIAMFDMDHGRFKTRGEAVNHLVSIYDREPVVRRGEKFMHVMMNRGLGQMPVDPDEPPAPTESRAEQIVSALLEA